VTLPSVTYTGTEVVLLVAMIAGSLPLLDQTDYEVADLTLDKALATLHRPLAPDLETRIAQLRHRGHLYEGDRP
jgi:hypothetical protein